MVLEYRRQGVRTGFPTYVWLSGQWRQRTVEFRAHVHMRRATVEWFSVISAAGMFRRIRVDRQSGGNAIGVTIVCARGPALPFGCWARKPLGIIELSRFGGPSSDVDGSAGTPLAFVGGPSRPFLKGRVVYVVSGFVRLLVMAFVEYRHLPSRTCRYFPPRRSSVVVCRCGSPRHRVCGRSTSIRVL